MQIEKSATARQALGQAVQHLPLLRAGEQILPHFLWRDVNFALERRNQFRGVLNLVEDEGRRVVFKEQVGLTARVFEVLAGIENDVIVLRENMPEQGGLANLTGAADDHRREGPSQLFEPLREKTLTIHTLQNSSTIIILQGIIQMFKTSTQHQQIIDM